MLVFARDLTNHLVRYGEHFREHWEHYSQFFIFEMCMRLDRKKCRQNQRLRIYHILSSLLIVAVCTLSEDALVNADPCRYFGMQRDQVMKIIRSESSFFWLVWLVNGAVSSTYMEYSEGSPDRGLSRSVLVETCGNLDLTFCVACERPSETAGRYVTYRWSHSVLRVHLVVSVVVIKFYFDGNLHKSDMGYGGNVIVNSFPISWNVES